MTATYEAIETQTLASSAASITFSSIASTYTDLRLVINNQPYGVDLTFNGDTSGSYSRTTLEGNGTTPDSRRDSNAARIACYRNNPSASGSTFWNTNIDIFNYANTSTYKTVLASYTTSSYVYRIVGLWRSTSAITSITVGSYSNFNAGTNATLYGIKAE